MHARGEPGDKATILVGTFLAYSVLYTNTVHHIHVHVVATGLYVWCAHVHVCVGLICELNS